VEAGLSNYWGYNTLGFFAPDSRFATGALGEQVIEFKSMVKAFHHAGIEVILDVVYNHTAEGNHLGPTLSMRGLDNRSYYLLTPNDMRHYADYTGCGNSLNMRHPRTIRLIMDSLRYWVGEMHVDGFRFDLAPTLARELHEVDRLGHFFAIVQQDPLLAEVKLIAEPWDLGPGGYQVGNFPAGWAEWNPEYRDTVRRFWRGDPGQVGDLASRLAGSADIYAQRERTPFASINFATCHDGFTLQDLVRYERKHNEANGEHNRDGNDANWSCNWGVEGPTEAQRIINLRERVVRNLLATLAFSQGVPMISHGDELGRSQGGNNNAYCQDNPASWVNWDLGTSEREILKFAQTVFKLRRTNPVLRRRSFFSGRAVHGPEKKDVMWLRADGEEMQILNWEDGDCSVLGMFVPGESNDVIDEMGHSAPGDTLLLLLNAGSRPSHFRLPNVSDSEHWELTLNTARPGTRKIHREAVNLTPHSLMLLTLRRPE
jgi:glycogen operon protein